MLLTDLHGVGPKLADKINALGIHQVRDLLFHLPIRYEDRTCIHPVGSCKPGQRVLIEGQVEHAAIVKRSPIDQAPGSHTQSSAEKRAC